MAKYSKFNLVYYLQKWMDSVAGQTFMNYAYSWGASIVILGTLFKLTHLPGANAMLFIGMGTEVFVFFIAAFDRPFDKTSEGRNLATDSELAAQLAEDGTPVNFTAGTSGGNISGNAPIIIGGASGGSVTNDDADGTVPVTGGSAPAAGGPVIIGGGYVGGGIPSGSGVISGSSESAESVEAAISETGVNTSAGINAGPIAVAPTPAPAVSPETAMAMEEATTAYVDRLNELNELLLKVGAQSNRLTTDSEEMENLNRTLTGIARVYEMQLKSASQQITTQDEINDQTRKLAQQIADLNAIYARMIEAMTVNMPGAAVPVK